MQQKINGVAAPSGAIIGGAIPAKLVTDNPQEPLGPVGTAPKPSATADISQAELMAELARLKAENERLKANTGPNLSFKVSEKGALAVYGLGRFPVTLYKGQWKKLIGQLGRLEKFMADNDQALVSKD